MRRISENRKNKPVRKEINERKEIVNLINFKNDLFYILQNYDKRILFSNDYDNLKNSKKYVNSKDRSHYLTISNENVDLGFFGNYKIRGLELHGCKRINLSGSIQIEELRLINVNIELDLFLKILEMTNLKYLELFNVNIYSRFDSVIRKIDNNFDETDSDEIFLKQDDTFDYEENNNNFYHEDIINNKIEKTLRTSLLKKLTLIETNIKLTTINRSGLSKKLSILRYKRGKNYVYFSYGFEIYSYLKTNCNKNLIYRKSRIGTGVCQNISIFSKITNDLIYKFSRDFFSVKEFCFIDCTFTQLSFYKFLDLFGKKIRYLNLIDSILPLDSLEFLRKSLEECKVVFRDRSIFKIIKNI